MSLEVIHIIEDDPKQARLLDEALRKARYRTHVSSEGPSGVLHANELLPNLILLDMVLPGMGGQDVLCCLQEDMLTKDIPVIMMSAMNSEADRIMALNNGADDFLLKPFSLDEVVAKIRAVLRRSLRAAVSHDLSLDFELVVEDEFRIINFRGTRLQVNAGEWGILHHLVKQAGKSVTPEELITVLWGNDGMIHDHELDRVVLALQEKLVAHGLPAGTIKSMPSVGYALTPQF